MPRRTALRDVASALGVSVSTVSRALAGRRGIGEAMRRRAADCARRMGYIHDPWLSSLAAGRFRQAGKPIVIATWIHNPSWLEVLRRQCATLGMVIHQLRGADAGIPDGVVECQAVALIVSHRIVAAEILARLTIPVVLWTTDGHGHGVDSIEPFDAWLATRMAVDRVRAAGYRSLCLVTTASKPRHWHDDQRLAVAQLESMPVLEWDGDPKSLRSFLRRHRPDAVIGLTHPICKDLRRLSPPMPCAALILHDIAWSLGVAGWVLDLRHLCQVTLEMIEQRLRYGPCPPRHVTLGMAWRDAPSLPRMAGG